MKTFYKWVSIIICAGILVFASAPAWSANYPLEIIAPQPSLTTTSRYYKAYPGLEYKVPIGVFGGAYPFIYSLMTYPAGMTINSRTGIITWGNPTVSGSPHSVTVSVTDSESTTVTRSWTITVTTTGFIFVDGSAGDGGTGTISSPFNSMRDFYGASLHDTTYAGYFVYWRAGTYSLQGTFENSGQQYCLAYPIMEKPHVWLAYPGESVVIDHSLTSGAYIKSNSWGDGNDVYIQGITFQDALNHFWRMGGQRQTFYDCIFNTWGPGVDGANSSAIMYASTGGINGYYYSFITGNTFMGMISGTANSIIKLYSGTKQVISDNIMRNVTGTSHEGIAIKATTTYLDVRNNRISGVVNHAIAGNWNGCGNLEIRYNLVLGADATYDGDGDAGALTINHDGTAGPAYIYRNTFNGVVLARLLDAGDGPFYFRDNVIVNENSGDVPAGGSHINCYGCINTSVLSITSANLVGYAANGIIDANGMLQGSYRTTYLGTKGYETEGSQSSPSPPRNLRIQ